MILPLTKARSHALNSKFRINNNESKALKDRGDAI